MRHRLSDRAGLLEAAEAVFSQHGYHSASMRDIARRAGFSVGGVYQFFESKDELYLAVLDAQWAAFRAEMRRALGTGDFLGQLGGLTRAWLGDIGARRAFWRMQLAEFWGFSSPLRDTITARHEEYLRQVRTEMMRIMRAGLREGVLRHLSVEVLTAAYLGILKQVVADTIVLGVRLPSAGAVLDGFLNGAARPGSRSC